MPLGVGTIGLGGAIHCREVRGHAADWRVSNDELEEKGLLVAQGAAVGDQAAAQLAQRRAEIT